MEPPAARMWRVCKCEARGDVLVIPGPVRLLSVRLSGKIHRHGRVIRIPRQHGLTALVKPIVQADTGRYLITMDFIWRLQQRVSQASSEHQARGDSPGVLEIELALVVPEIPGDQVSGVEKVPSLVLVVLFVRFCEQARNRSGCEVIISAEGGIHGRISPGSRIQTGCRVCDSGNVQPVNVRARGGKVLCITGAVVRNDPQIAAELERVLS